MKASSETLTTPTFPPGPMWPRRVQQAFQMAGDYRFLQWCFHRYGDIYALTTFGEQPFVVTAAPDLAKAVLGAKGSVADRGDIGWAFREAFGETGVIIEPNGPSHRRHRRMIMPAYHGGRIVKWTSDIIEITDEAVDRLPIGEPVRIRPVMQHVMLEVAIRTIFGVSHDGDDLGLHDAVAAVAAEVPAGVELIVASYFNRSGRSRRYVPGGRYFDALRTVDRVLGAHIVRRRDNVTDEFDDVLGTLLDVEYDDGGKMTDTEIRDQLLSLLLAGHETSATTASWF